MKPEELLKEGVKILDPFMNNNNFKFHFENSGRGSGGDYAFGKYKNKNKILELHYRYALGKVNYQISNNTLYHDDYMRMLGVYGKNHYPGFSHEPLQAFRDLLFDLENYAINFIIGHEQEFINLAIKFNTNPSQYKGFKSLPK